MVPPIVTGKVKRKKARRILTPTPMHYTGSVAHRTINGQGAIARLRKKKGK